MGVIVAQRPQPVEFFLSGCVPQAELDVCVVNVNVWSKVSIESSKEPGFGVRTVYIVFCDVC